MNILVFTDSDLDGSGSALFIKWLYSNKLKDFIVVETTESMIVNEFKSRAETLDHFDKIFVLDLCLSKEQAEAIDRNNLVVIDHHLPHVKIKNIYKQGKAIIEEYSSCIALLRDKFKTAINLSAPQQELITYIDDYDCYNLKYRDSLKLNAIYKTYNKPKVDKFIEAFYGGFRPYNVQEKNSIKLYINKFRDQLNNAPNFGTIKHYNAVAIFADFSVSEVAHYLITKYKADIGIVVNLKTNTVSFRRCTHCDVDVSVLAQTLCEGGGSPSVAGGKLTMQFANLIKDFKPCT